MSITLLKRKCLNRPGHKHQQPTSSAVDGVALTMVLKYRRKCDKDTDTDTDRQSGRFIKLINMHKLMRSCVHDQIIESGN